MGIRLRKFNDSSPKNSLIQLSVILFKLLFPEIHLIQIFTSSGSFSPSQNLANELFARNEAEKRIAHCSLLVRALVPIVVPKAGTYCLRTAVPHPVNVISRPRDKAMHLLLTILTRSLHRLIARMLRLSRLSKRSGAST